MEHHPVSLLIADDEAFSRELLRKSLVRAGFEVRAACDGNEAWEALHANDAPRLAILDRQMPGIDGLEICRRVRAEKSGGYVYLILLTGQSEKDDIVAGLEAGADDYVTKPFNANELVARVRTGLRIIGLETALATKVAELENTHMHVQRLEGLLPICMCCKKIRDEKNDWHQLEAYMQEHSTLVFTHSICAECSARFYPKGRSQKAS